MTKEDKACKPKNINLELNKENKQENSGYSSNMITTT